MARVLVIEDDLAVGDTMQGMLRSGGHEVVLALRGDEGLRLFQEQGFDLILCDVHMPGKDGFEVIEEVRRCSPDTPIISMTGRLSTRQRWRSPRSRLPASEQQSRRHESACQALSGSRALRARARLPWRSGCDSRSVAFGRFLMCLRVAPR